MELGRLEWVAYNTLPIFVSNSSYLYLVNATHAVDRTLPVGNVSYDPKTAVFSCVYDGSKSERLLGLKYRTLEECATDTLKQFKEKGWTR